MKCKIPQRQKILNQKARHVIRQQIGYCSALVLAETWGWGDKRLNDLKPMLMPCMRCMMTNTRIRMSTHRCLSVCLQTDRTPSDREAAKRCCSAESMTLHTSVTHISCASAGLASAESKHITRNCKSASGITTGHFLMRPVKSLALCKTD